MLADIAENQNKAQTDGHGVLTGASLVHMVRGDMALNTGRKALLSRRGVFKRTCHPSTCELSDSL